MPYTSRYFKYTLYLGSVLDLIKLLNDINTEVVRPSMATKYISTTFVISIVLTKNLERMPPLNYTNILSY